MKKRKSTKAKIRNLVRISVILMLSLIISIIFCKKENAANDKILESTVKDAFVFKSILITHDLEPNEPNSYSDIESLENDTTDAFVSDAAIKTGISQYYIRVNYTANCVNIYTKDKDGNYTKPYKSMICSTGKSTPKSGTYKISYKYRWLKLFGNVYGQYSTRIVKNILFHSVPYYEQRADTLEWDEYDKLGTTASAGCIRLTVQDAKWIYDNITTGTYVEFYSDKDNPGPLGKPTAQKISDNKNNRNWDPTDPDKNNPWNGGNGKPSIIYTQPTESTNENKTNTKNTNTINNSNTIETNKTNSNTNNTPTTSHKDNSNHTTNNTTTNETNISNTHTNTAESTNTTIDNTPTSTPKPTPSNTDETESLPTQSDDKETISTQTTPEPSNDDKQPNIEEKPDSDSNDNLISIPEKTEEDDV